MKKILIALAIIISSTIGLWNVYGKSITTASATHPTAAVSNPIQDPQLQQAWEQLNSLTEPIQTADGATLTGHDLAQYILKNNIQIKWDVDNVCKGNSCSVRYHVHGSSVYTHDGEPIYIRLELKGEPMALLIESMAHEIYHYTEPYGQVDDSWYEEYQAYNLSAQITHTTGLDDTCNAPLKLTDLKQWMEKHNILYGYVKYQPYPPSLAASADTSEPAAPAVEQPASAMATQAPSTANPACTINTLGLLDCQH